MPNVNVEPFEIETTSRHGDILRADVYLPRDAAGLQTDLAPLLQASPWIEGGRPLSTARLQTVD